MKYSLEELAQQLEDYLECMVVTEEEIKGIQSFFSFMTNGRVELDVTEQTVKKVDCIYRK